MTLAEQIISDVVNVFHNTDDFAEEIAYTAEGGSPRTIKAVVERDEQLRYESDGVSTYQQKTAKLYVSVAAVQTAKVARHSLRGDKFHFDDLEWKIVAEGESDSAMRVLTVVATVRVDYDMGSRMK